MSVLDRYKVPYVKEMNTSWEMDRFFSTLPDLALFIENGIVPAVDHTYFLQFIPEKDSERKMYETIQI